MREKTCKICKAKFIPERQFQNWCTPNCAYEIVKKQRASSDKRKKQKEHKKLREMKEKLKTPSDYMKIAQQAVNAYIRFRDRGKPCISCGASSVDNRRILGMRGGAFDAGHYRSRGSAPHLRFYTLNIFSQCKQCNRHLHGNSIEMRNGLVKAFGLEFVERLDSLYYHKKYNIDYLKRVIRVFRKKLRVRKRIQEGKDIL